MMDQINFYFLSPKKGFRSQIDGWEHLCQLQQKEQRIVASPKGFPKGLTMHYCIPYPAAPGIFSTLDAFLDPSSLTDKPPG